ncbi:MAG TPA: EpsG family protein [Allosphingosinicella sp.]
MAIVLLFMCNLCREMLKAVARGGCGTLDGRCATSYSDHQTLSSLPGERAEQFGGEPPGGFVFPYWLLFSMCAAGAMTTRKADNRSIPPLLLAVALFTTIFIGFRYQVGGDWINYLRIFNLLEYANLGRVVTFADPAYAMLNKIAHMLGVEVWFVNLVCAAIFTWGLTVFCARQPNPWLGFVVAVPYLVIVVGMGYTRQAAAIGFILIGLAQLERHSIFRFAVYAIIAAAFHKSAIAAIPLVALGSARGKVMHAALMAVLGIMIFYVFVERGMAGFTASYVNQQYDAQGAAVRVLMNIIPATIFLLFMKRFDITPAQRVLWRNFSIGAYFTLALLFLVASSTIADRLALYLIPLQVFVFSRLPYAFPRNGKPDPLLVVAVVAYSALVQFVWLTQAQHADAWLPYRFYPLLS